MSQVFHTWAFILQDWNEADRLAEWALAMGVGGIIGAGILFLWDWLI